MTAEKRNQPAGSVTAQFKPDPETQAIIRELRQKMDDLKSFRNSISEAAAAVKSEIKELRKSQDSLIKEQNRAHNLSKRK